MWEFLLENFDYGHVSLPLLDLIHANGLVRARLAMKAFAVPTGPSVRYVRNVLCQHALSAISSPGRVPVLHLQPRDQCQRLGKCQVPNRWGEKRVLQRNHHLTIPPITMIRVAAQKTLSDAVVYLGNLNKP